MKYYKFAFLLSLSLLLSACSISLADDLLPPPGANVEQFGPVQTEAEGPHYPLVPPDPANGATIYAEKCAPCHGVTGRGDGPQANQLPQPPTPLALPEVARQSTPAGWYAIITQGDMENYMPPFNSLSERQRWDVVAYLYTLSASPETIELGQELYQANCAECHGLAGRGDGPQAAGSDVAPTRLSSQAFMASISASELYQVITAGMPPAMPAYAEQLADEERWALTDYLRSLSFTTTRATAGSAETAGGAAAEGSRGTIDPAVEVPEPGLGTITVQVVPGSGGEIPADMEVTLHGFDNMQEAYKASATATAKGAFVFEEVEMPPGRAFIASVEYGQATYGSELFRADAGVNQANLTIPVYESTTDTSVLSVDRLHIFFDYEEPDTLKVVQLYIISNPSGRTVVAPAEGDPVLTFDLPAGATNLQFENGFLGGRFVETARGFGDTAAVLPGAGEYQLVFAYDMPYQRRLDLVQPVNLPVNAVVILIPDDNIKVRGNQIQDEGLHDVQSRSYRMYSSDSLAAGTDLTMTISGRPGAAGLGLVASSTAGLVVGLAALGLSLVAAGVWLYTRKGGESQAEVLSGDDELQTEADLVETTPEDPDALIEAILALDDLHQSGELPREVYQQRRAELKARLSEAMSTGL